ncbi:hypothetical protein ATANTOWER_026304 [Ataeniobius toweri]|uniref:Secreted protein n=1 Tax=Ataeniobius toweri TaxID=208326 RepID=A0ABU7AHY1_9TELE|nr:hypothetical protein [Ataeniobius toweri]
MCTHFFFPNTNSSLPWLPLLSLCAQRQACDASPTPSERTALFQPEPDVTPAPMCTGLIATNDAKDTSSCMS